MIEGKVFYEHGDYSISIHSLTAEQVEAVIRKLKGTVLLKRCGYTG